MFIFTGASGFLGKIAFPIIAAKHKIIGLCRANDYNGKFIPVDITNHNATINVLNKYNPDIVIHSAACREPDICEKNPEFTYKLNSDATENIAKWCAENSKKLIYISTDYVFDGLNPPYNENDPISPCNVYGKSKAIGESYVRNVDNHIIVRIPLQYGFSTEKEDSLISKIINALKLEKTYEVNHSQVRYPTLSDDVAHALNSLIDIDFTGTIHLSSQSAVTRYDIWKKVSEVFDLKKSEIIPTDKPVKQFAPRPPNSHLSTNLYESLNLYKFHSFDEGLQIIKNKMN